MIIFHAFIVQLKELNGTTLVNNLYDDGGIILNDGAKLGFEQDEFIGYDRYIFVDVNGDKGPDTLGKDIFGVRILNNRILPIGAPESVIKSSLSRK